MSFYLGISVVLLTTILLLGGLCVNSNDTVTASSAAKTGNKILKKSGETSKEIVSGAADVLNEISKSVREGINVDNPGSKPSINTGVQNSDSSLLLEVPSLNESASDTRVDNSDMIATKMQFKKQNPPPDLREVLSDFATYNLKDQNFVVSNNSRICPDQNCKFQFRDTTLAYQPGSNDITLDGTMKIDTGEVTKITKFSSRFQPTEAREQNGLKTEVVQGTFGVGKEPINSAEIEYNVNGTLESHGGQKTLSLQGVQCNGINNDNSKQIDCNY